MRLLGWFVLLGTAASAPPYEIGIRDGHIVDGGASLVGMFLRTPHIRDGRE